MRTKKQVVDFLESKVGGGVKCKGNPALDNECVTLIKSLMEFLGVPNPYRARGHGKDCISKYLNEGIADKDTGFISVFSNRNMGNGYGHIWLNAGEGKGTYYESNGVKPKLVTKGKTYSYDMVCNFDKYIGEDSGDELTECLKQHTELVSKCNEKDKKIEELIVERNNIGESYKQLKNGFKAEEIAHKATKKNHQGFVDTLADIFGSVHSDESVIKFASKNSNAFDDYLKFQSLYEKEQQARKNDFIKHQKEVEDLQAQLDDLKTQNDRLASKLTNLGLQISNKLDEVDEAKDKIKPDEIAISKSFIKQIVDFIKLLFKR